MVPRETNESFNINKGILLDIDITNANGTTTSWHNPFVISLILQGFPVDTSKPYCLHVGLKTCESHIAVLFVDLSTQRIWFVSSKPTLEHFSSYSKFVVIVLNKQMMTTTEMEKKL